MLKWALILVPLAAVVVYQVLVQMRPKVKRPNELNPQYDYVIVGGGTAGCVLASRLSEDGTKSVLLLEAGVDESHLFFGHLPGAAPLLQNTLVDWQHLTTPQDDCCSSLEDRQVKWPAGKMLGGSSSLHLSVHVRPSSSDFDSWQQAFSNENGTYSKGIWTHQTMKPYLNKIESVQIDRLKMGLFAGQHGHSGPVVVSENTQFQTPLGQVFSQALFSHGFSYLEDNSQAVEGFGTPQFMVARGRRVSAASAYLRPAMVRPNLHVVTQAHVYKVTFEYDDESKKAVGVEYDFEGARHRVLANNEIVLSAGAVGSPQLLLASGIGPGRQLEQLGIRPIRHLNQVGENLRDHVGVILRYGSPEPFAGQDLTSFWALLHHTLRYLVQGAGPLAFPPIEFTGYMKSDEAQPGADVQFYLLHADPYSREFGNLTTFQQQDEEGLHFAVALGVLLLAPHSAGAVRLQSADARTPPLIDPHYFADEHDLDRLVRAAHRLDRILADALLPHRIRRMDRLDECADADDPLRCLVRNRPQSGFHPHGSCRMGARADDSVVDEHLRVHGVRNLRVVDASVIPGRIAANPCAAVMAIAERAADLIKSG